LGSVIACRPRRPRRPRPRRPRRTDDRTTGRNRTT